MRVLYDGYVYMDGDGLQRVEIYDDDGFVYAYVGDNLCDDVSNAEGFARHYGSELWPSIDAFRRVEGAEDVRDVWK